MPGEDRAGVFAPPAGKGCLMTRRPTIGLASLFLAGAALAGCQPGNRHNLYRDENPAAVGTNPTPANQSWNERSGGSSQGFNSGTGDSRSPTAASAAGGLPTAKGTGALLDTGSVQPARSPDLGTPTWAEPKKLSTPSENTIRPPDPPTKTTSNAAPHFGMVDVAPNSGPTVADMEPPTYSRRSVLPVESDMLPVEKTVKPAPGPQVVAKTAPTAAVPPPAEDQPPAPGPIAASATKPPAPPVEPGWQPYGTPGPGPVAPPAEKTPSVKEVASPVVPNQEDALPPAPVRVDQRETQYPNLTEKQ
jgi:hypothetical protein